MVNSYFIRIPEIWTSCLLLQCTSALSTSIGMPKFVRSYVRRKIYIYIFIWGLIMYHVRQMRHTHRSLMNMLYARQWFVLITGSLALVLE
jgi:hypothetical protein